MVASRRHFIQLLPLTCASLCVAGTAFADAPHVDPKDAQAAGLGYSEDATKVDKAKFSKYAAGEQCSNCQFFQGKAADAFGPCSIFPGKAVSSKGWCNVYSKKA